MSVIFRVHVLICLWLCENVSGSRCLFPWRLSKMNAIHPENPEIKEESTVSLLKEYPAYQIPKFEALSDDILGTIIEYLDLDEGLKLRLVSKSLQKSFDLAMRRAVGMSFWNRYISDHIVMLEYSNVSALVLTKRVSPILEYFLDPKFMRLFRNQPKRLRAYQFLDELLTEKLSFVDFCNLLIPWFYNFDLFIMASFVDGLLRSQLIGIEMLKWDTISDWDIVFEICCIKGLKLLAWQAFLINEIHSGYMPSWSRSLLHRVCLKMIQNVNLVGFTITLDTSIRFNNVFESITLNVFLSYIINMDNDEFLDALYTRFPDLCYASRLPAIIANGRVKTLKYLLDRLANLETMDKGSSKLLHLAAKSNDPKIISMLMRAGYTDVMAKNAEGFIPIHRLLSIPEPNIVSVSLFIEQARRQGCLYAMLAVKFPHSWKTVYDEINLRDFDRLI